MLRRRLSLGLLGVAVVALGALALYWFWAADRAATAIAQWTEEQRARGYEIAYRGPEIRGFPVKLAVRFTEPSIGAPQGWRWSGGAIAGEAAFWQPRRLRLDLPLRQTLSADWRGHRRELSLEAETARGLIHLGPDGWLKTATIEMERLVLGAPGGGTQGAAILRADRLRYDVTRRPPTLEGTDGWTLLLSGEMRGIGGTFYDHLRFDKDKAFAYCVNLGMAFPNLYRPFIEANREKATTDAQREFRDAIERDDGLASAHHFLAWMLAQTGESDEAIRHYRRAIELKPHRIDSSLQLAKTLAFAGRMAEVVSVLRDVVTEHDVSVEAHHNLAFALRELGDLPEAVTHYSRAVELAPDNPEVHFQLGQTYAEMKRHEEATKHLERAVQIDPRYRKIIADAARP
ncbi:MAG: coproporphyrinogen III oxidase [Proteobacteria bacterium]|nr:coproporphyrinogen III oxidase [Pseudomonadota bacterium]